LYIFWKYILKPAAFFFQIQFRTEALW